MSRKEEIIVDMLRRYHEAQDGGLSGEPGDGTHVPLMPTTWNHSYRELERCLKAMRDVRPKQYRHVRERFLNEATAVLVVGFTKNAQPKLPPHCELIAGAAVMGEKKSRVRVRTWAPWVRNEEVRKGVVWLAENFRGEPYLPIEFREAA